MPRPQAPKKIPKHQTTMRIQDDVLRALDVEAIARGMDRTEFAHQVWARFLRGCGHKLKVRDRL